jgi:penicillin-binding protein
VTLSWKSGGEADLIGYRIYRANGSNGFVRVATVKDPAVLSYTDASANGGRYYVTAVDITGQESAPSAAVSAGNSTGTWEVPTAPGQTESPLPEPNDPGIGNGGDPIAMPPSAPKSLTLTKVQGGWKLQWKRNSTNEQVIAYNVYFSPDPATGYLLLESVTGTSYVHMSEDNSGTYYITAVNSFGESPQSNSVAAH